MNAARKVVRTFHSHSSYSLQIGRVQAAPRTGSEVAGRSLGDVVDVDSDRAVLFADVAEPALAGTGDQAGRLIGRESADQRAHVGDELGVDRGGGAADVGVGVPHLAAGVFAPELREGPGDRVLVDPDLGMVRRAGTAGLGVGNEQLVVLLADQVGFAGDGGGGAAEMEEVLVLGMDLVADAFQALSFPVDQGGVLEYPGGAVEVGGRLGPALVMCPEPTGPLAGVLAGEELGQGCGPDVGASGACLSIGQAP